MKTNELLAEAISILDDVLFDLAEGAWLSGGKVLDSTSDRAVLFLEKVGRIHEVRVDHKKEGCGGCVAAKG